MKEIGEYLRQAREKKNISLRDIQETTKIRLRYLEAIEQGDLEQIPGEVYRRGFLVNYANAIGIDADEVLRKYNELKNPYPEQRIAPPQISSEKEKSDPPKKAEMTTAQPARSGWLKGIYWGVGAALLGIVILLLLMPLFRSPDHAKVKPVAKTAVPSPKKDLVQEQPASTSSPTPSATPNVAAAQPEAPAATPTTSVTPTEAPIQVEAEFSDRVWVRINADGASLLTREFNSGDAKQSWTAQKTMEITFGNPAGVHLSLNGKDLGPIGKYGVPITIKLTPSGMEAP